MRFIFSIVSSLLSLLVIVTVVGAVLAVTGTPEACVDREVPSSPIETIGLVANWAAFEAQASRGEATIDVTEAQATSIGTQYIEEKDVPVEDLQVFFCPDGTAEAAGKVSALGISANVVVRGTLDLSGAKPQIQIDEIKAGNLPSSASTSLVNFVLERKDFRTLDIEPRLLEIDYADGTATIRGGAR
jgi:hypothetical protein